MRLFFAIPLSEEIKNLTEDLILQLEKKNLHSDIKWVSRENLHVTLVFVENFPQEKIEVVKSKIDNLPKPDFWLLQLGEIGYFPPKGQAKVFKISLGGDLDKIGEYQKNICEILRQEGVVFDDKPFTPHLTLGRIKWQRGPLAKFVEFDPLAFPVTEVQMISSLLQKDKPQYQILHSFKNKKHGITTIGVQNKAIILGIKIDDIDQATLEKS